MHNRPHCFQLSRQLLLSLAAVALFGSCGHKVGYVESPGHATEAVAERGMVAHVAQESVEAAPGIPLFTLTDALFSLSLESAVLLESGVLLGSEVTSVQSVEPIAVTFRLGPKMGEQTFHIEEDGTVDADQMKDLRKLFRCKRSKRTHRIHPGLLAKIADLASQFEGHTLEVVSAYRHGSHASPGSRHGRGSALDLRVVGVSTETVRDYLWARYQQEVGVGFYKQQRFIHLDHRKNYPATAWTQRRYNSQNSYNPRWSRAERRSTLVAALEPSAQGSVVAINPASLVLR